MIKTTLIGHASMLIQSREATILTDPVWFDYLWEETNVLCPSIELGLDKIPPVDILNLSHRHQDHFDVRTLAYLAQNKSILKPDVMVLVPKDDILIDVLKELEYENIQVVEDFEPIRLLDVTLTPTPSFNEGDYYPEHGLLVHDGEVTIWNQVDTVVVPEIISFIHKLYGQVDFAHSRFLPLLEGNFSHNKALGIPFNEYSSFLQVVGALRPKFVVPGSAAFRYRDELAFLNQYSFPTTPDQFLADMAIYCPEIKTSTFYPGDVAHITKEGVKIGRQTSDFVRVQEDDSHKVAFKPVMEVPPIKSLNGDPVQHEKEIQIIKGFLENQLIDKLNSCEKVDGWRHWQTLYQLEVFGPNGTSNIWNIDFRNEDLKIQEDCLPKTTLYEGISASDLVCLIEGRTSWDFVGISGCYRTFNNVYRVGQGTFEFFPTEKDFPLPLLQVFPSDRKMDREKYMRDVRRWKGKA
ncbi:MAG: MBL fold metallo-hydrolase [Candidatus Marinimicrobia bacterium]|nr:MBL fold metallo-hydrolase [Candidatus Neomarinimicrobiota bacterium]